MEYEKQREFSRVGIELEVRLRFADGSIVTGRAVDASLNGVRCLTDERPELGRSCDVTMVFAEGSEAPLELHSEGRVVRHDADGVAIEHVAIELESLEHLRNLLLVWSHDRRTVSEEFREHVGLKRRDPDDDLPGY